MHEDAAAPRFYEIRSERGGDGAVRLRSFQAVEIPNVWLFVWSGATAPTAAPDQLQLLVEEWFLEWRDDLGLSMGVTSRALASGRQGGARTLHPQPRAAWRADRMDLARRLLIGAASAGAPTERAVAGLNAALAATAAVAGDTPTQRPES